MRPRALRPNRWLSSVFLKTLRGYRIPIIGWGYGMSLLVLEVVAGASAITTTAAGRKTLVELAASFSWNAAPVAVDTPAGYATFKIGLGVVIFAIWPLLAGSRTLRGEEEYGSLDVLLSVPRSRLRIALEKVAAIGAALLGMALLIGIVTFAGGVVFNGGYSVSDALLFGLDLALLGAVFAGVALLISQFTYERRYASGWTAAVLLVAAVLDMVHRIWPGTEWVSQLSPVYYYNLSKPLIASYGTTPWAMVLLLALAAALGSASVWLFAQRDVNGVVALPAWMRLRRHPRQQAVTLPAREWSLRSYYLRSLRAAAMPTLWWTLGLAGFAAWMVVAVKQISGQLSGLYATPGISTILGRLGGGDVHLTTTLLSAIFSLLPLLLMAFAVTQVNRWASDEEDGRIELVLATPRSRASVILGRFAALATTTTFIVVITFAACAASAALSGVDLNRGDLAAATLGMIPLGLLIAAIGYVSAGWLRSAADTGLLSILLALWFLLSFVGPDLQWPDALLRLSPFYYYGTPLLHGLQAAAVLGLLAAAAGALAVGTLRFSRKDLAR